MAGSEDDGGLWFTGTSTSPLLAATPGALALSGDAYIARLSADGSHILISLHGVTGSFLARDPAGNLIVAGVASGPLLPPDTWHRYPRHARRIPDRNHEFPVRKRVLRFPMQPSVRK
jgi:hypothetical protein